ncbi:MAG: YggS family pyridoxal phosphate-dependent enzyme [Enterococcus sp.]
MIADNLHEIEQAIQDSCALVHRNPNEVTLIAVTKYVDSETTRKVIATGIKNIAENRAEKLIEKKHQLVDIPDIKWHLIGNLQRRKVKSIINEIDYFHALDSLRLAEEIEKRAEKTISCFVEVNVSGEESKQGIPPSEVHTFIESLAVYPKIKVVGLMTMAPFDATTEELHEVFHNLSMLRDTVRESKYAHAPCEELSMGMSQDFSVAIEEGATFIRVGRALLRD